MCEDFQNIRIFLFNFFFRWKKPISSGIFFHVSFHFSTRWKKPVNPCAIQGHPVMVRFTIDMHVQCSIA